MIEGYEVIELEIEECSSLPVRENPEIEEYWERARFNLLHGEIKACGLPQNMSIER